jgi:predicted RecB family nuclease
VKVISQQVRLAATDVSNHLACHHLTYLELSVARGERAKPEWAAPDLVVIQELGLRHETKYLTHLKENGLEVVNLADAGSEAHILAETRRAMEQGADVIAQGALGNARWFGRPDVLRKVAKASRLGNWSYEVYDCKLARETKATTILQLSFYSELLEQVQGLGPECMYVVPRGRGFKEEPYRVEEYAAYYRRVKSRLEKGCEGEGLKDTYPEPCVHCDVCVWFKECDTRRRADDHLSLVAGITKLQRKQLVEWQFDNASKLAEMAIPLKEKPLHGSRDGMKRVREQARVQIEGRNQGKPVHELLPVAAGMGFCRLPEPAPGDVFVDLEGDRFAGDEETGGGQEYLFGFVSGNGGRELRYEKRWAFTAAEEKAGFEWLVDEITQRREKFTEMHLYHFGHYEKERISKLASRYATRETEVDFLLRGELFVDLHTISKQAVLAGVEEYSLKQLEAFYGFDRKTPLDESRMAMRFIEHRLELGWDDEELPGRFRDAMEAYNADDCFSTAALRDWLELCRKKKIEEGALIPRLEKKDGTAKDKIKEREERVAALVNSLCDGIPIDPRERSGEQSARWLLAQLLGWHRREERREWQEGFRLAKLDEQALLDERVGLAGLRFKENLRIERQIPTDRYSFEPQKTNIRVGKDVYIGTNRLGEVQAISSAEGTIDIKKTKKTADVHPSSIYMWSAPFLAGAQADSLLRIGRWVNENTIDAPGSGRAVRDLLLRKPPTLGADETLAPLPEEETKSTACRISGALKHSILAMQGPPGAGKTYTGARMICQLVKQGKKVGVTALSHKVIRNLLDAVVDAAEKDGIEGVKCMQKVTKVSDVEPSEKITIVTKDNQVVLDALFSGTANVVGGTCWLWADEDSYDSVDTLFVDEAGQMALADVIAAGQAAKSVVLIGDPQQLQRPIKGSHPDGAEKSALDHLIGEHKTISPEMGILLPETWRLHPKVCEFTSNMFYEGKLTARPITHARVIEGHPWLNGAGLWFVPVSHEGNRNSSPEEVEVVSRIVDSLLKVEVKWLDDSGNRRSLKREEDILIVAPYNAQVSDLSERLPGSKVGTVDKFQGQEAPVVIYSLTTSSPEDAPRGMEFLYSLNRFNVATSRAMSTVVVVGNANLFAPDCRSPRQMQLANALSLYLELATIVEAPRQ